MLIPEAISFAAHAIIGAMKAQGQNHQKYHGLMSCSIPIFILTTIF